MWLNILLSILNLKKGLKKPCALYYFLIFFEIFFYPRINIIINIKILTSAWWFNYHFLFLRFIINIKGNIFFFNK